MSLLRSRHVRFFQRWLGSLPTSASSIMDKRPLMSFFSICGKQFRLCSYAWLRLPVTSLKDMNEGDKKVRLNRKNIFQVLQSEVYSEGLSFCLAALVEIDMWTTEKKIYVLKNLVEKRIIMRKYFIFPLTQSSTRVFTWIKFSERNTSHIE